LKSRCQRELLDLGRHTNGPFGRRLQVAKKLLQQRAVIRAELDILTEYNGSVCVRGRELKVTD
jgi:hypothetical protein